jgi:hypothetical protein
MQLNSISSVSFPTSSDIALRERLGRFVFDAMLELDLLGVMLSSKHFKLFLSKLDYEGTTRERDLAREILDCEQELAAFHQFMLQMFSAVYIEECRHNDQDALMADLDEKCASLNLDVSEMQDDDDVVNEVELAWRYRRVCSGENTLSL